MIAGSGQGVVDVWLATACGPALHLAQGRLAQLVEHLVYTERVGGSSPSPPTTPETVRFKSKFALSASRVGERPGAQLGDIHHASTDWVSVMSNEAMAPPKAEANDLLGRFREVVSDPINVLIERVPLAGVVHNNEVYLLNGNRVPISGAGAYYAGFSQLLVINRGVHEPLEEFVFQELVKHLPPAPQMIELGAYWAHYSMWLKKLRPQATTIMVEPDPTCLAAGRNNFARNGFVGEFIQAVVSRLGWKVDEFMSGREIDRIDILHVDIQGFELEMIAGAHDALANARINYLFISTHTQQIHHKTIEILKQYGYRIEVTSDFDLQTTSYDGFVFASSPQVNPLFDGFVAIGRAALATSSPDDVLSALAKVRRSIAR
jgi:Methyltransferase FkbM domain